MGTFPHRGISTLWHFTVCTSISCHSSVDIYADKDIYEIEYVNLFVMQSLNTDMGCIIPLTFIKSDSGVRHKTNEERAINTSRLHCDKKLWRMNVRRKDDKLFRWGKEKKSRSGTERKVVLSLSTRPCN